MPDMLSPFPVGRTSQLVKEACLKEADYLKVCHSMKGGRSSVSMKDPALTLLLSGGSIENDGSLSRLSDSCSWD